MLIHHRKPQAGFFKKNPLFCATRSKAFVINMSYTQKNLNSHSKWNLYTDYALVAGGILLVFIEFCLGRGFFMDEASLALNIANRTPKQLLQPLDSVQVAPIGFLQGIKICVYV